MLNFLGTYVIEDRKRLECKLLFIHSLKRFTFISIFDFLYLLLFVNFTALLNSLSVS